MSPEQARGKPVDKRTDIWAFGVVLYELLTGERLFKGEDASETLAQVLTKQPDFARAPAKARRLLRECLEKDPKARLRDIGDARRLLEEPAQGMALRHRRDGYRRLDSGPLLASRELPVRPGRTARQTVLPGSHRGDGHSGRTGHKYRRGSRCSCGGLPKT